MLPGEMFTTFFKFISLPGPPYIILQLCNFPDAMCFPHCMCKHGGKATESDIAKGDMKRSVTFPAFARRLVELYDILPGRRVHLPAGEPNQTQLLI